MVRKTLAAGAITAFLAMPLAAAEKNPYAEPDDTWISLSGTVQKVTPDVFTLDYGDGVVRVEMDDGDRDADAYKLLEGDKVTVTGLIDDEFYERTKIEASSVYVEKLGTYFYASAVDEEDGFVTIMTPIDIADVRFQGTVTEVRDEEFVLNTGLQSLTVETEELGYDPLDEEGYQQIEVGDLVTVSGNVDSDLFEGREVVAEAVTTLAD